MTTGEILFAFGRGLLRLLGVALGLAAVFILLTGIRKKFPFLTRPFLPGWTVDVLAGSIFILIVILVGMQ